MTPCVPKCGEKVTAGTCDFVGEEVEEEEEAEPPAGADAAAGPKQRAGTKANRRRRKAKEDRRLMRHVFDGAGLDVVPSHPSDLRTVPRRFSPMAIAAMLLLHTPVVVHNTGITNTAFHAFSGFLLTLVCKSCCRSAKFLR